MRPRSSTYLSLAAAFLATACSSKPEILTVSSGTSFGFCAPTAYCQTQLQITSSTATLLRTTRSGAGPVVVTGAVTLDQWDRITAAVDQKALESLPAVVGCPDCADGGAEWVEVTTDAWSKRVTFEYGSSPRGLETLLERVRELHTRLAPPVSVPGS